MAVSFFFEDINPFDIQRRNISKWIKKTIEIETFTLGNVSIIFCSDSYLLSINQRYLNHDYYTDIITFEYNVNNQISGDLFISVDTVKSNSDEYRKSFDDELNRVIIHGILHLIGFKDKTLKDKEVMTSKEDQYLLLLLLNIK